METLDLYLVTSQSLAVLLALLFYFGITPRRIRSLIISLVRFSRFHPQIIVALLVIVIVNLVIVSFKSVGWVRILGVASSCLIIVVLASTLVRYSTKRVPSPYTQLLAVVAVGFHGISELSNKAKIVIQPYGPWEQWLETALETYQISFVPIIVPRPEWLIALERGVIDAVLIREHPSGAVGESIASGKVRLLPWSEQAIEAVTKAFPTATRPAVLPSNTYPGQAETIQGYAPY